MKPAYKILLVIALSMLCLSTAWAQRTYPAAQGLPDDVVWMREIYRTLDLTQGANGALYYPVEPQDGRANLFTTLFKLIAQKKVAAYEYQLDGTERFSTDAQIGLRDLLDRFQIYYELKPSKNSRDSLISLHNSDIPSADVLSYFVKEVWYFDQRTSTFGSAITALCPVLHRSEEFSAEKVKLPMFWVSYEDVASYLAQSEVATSNYNNAATGSWDNFFASRLYEGHIYKVTNLQQRTLMQYCPTDSAMRQEQLRLEKEIADFEKGLYGNDLKEEGDVNTSDNASTAKQGKAAIQRKRTVEKRASAVSPSKEKNASLKEEKQSNSSAPKASVRRQRR